MGKAARGKRRLVLTPGSVKVVARKQSIVAANDASMMPTKAFENCHSASPHVRKKSAIGTSVEHQAHT